MTLIIEGLSKEDMHGFRIKSTIVANKKEPKRGYFDDVTGKFKSIFRKKITRLRVDIFLNGKEEIKYEKDIDGNTKITLK